MTYLRLILIFVTTMSLCWLTAWLSGYDFNSRGYGVAAYTVISLAGAFVLTGFFLDKPQNTRNNIE